MVDTAPAVNKWISTLIANATEKMMKQKDERIRKDRRNFDAYSHFKDVWLGASIFLLVDGDKILRSAAPIDSEVFGCMQRYAETLKLLVFTCLALFNSLISPLNSFPWVINGLIDAFISARRLSRFLCCADSKSERELEVNSPSCLSTDQYDSTFEDMAVIMHDASCSWSSGDEKDLNLVLNHVNLQPTKGFFYCSYWGDEFPIKEWTSGRVGSGKSSLLNSILGETLLVCGSIHSSGSIAYVPQVPWILSGTIRDNVLFGKNYDPGRYSDVVRACALDVDISLMIGNDMAYIGEKGLNLSGGQRARLALARAIYHGADIYMLDDVLSAVDAQVARWILSNGIMGPLMAQKTRILCTHNVQAISSADMIIVNGQRPCDVDKNAAQVLSTQDKPNHPEEKDVVSINYAAFSGWVITFVICLSAILMQASRNGNDLWLSYWVDTTGSNETQYSTSFYLVILCTFCIANSFLTLLRAFSFAYGGLQAAVQVHNTLVNKIINAPVLFFDQTPGGRILNRLEWGYCFGSCHLCYVLLLLLNSFFSSIGALFTDSVVYLPCIFAFCRFSSDLYTIDDSLPFILNILVANFVGLLGIAVVLSYVQVLSSSCFYFYRFGTYIASYRYLFLLGNLQMRDLLKFEQLELIYAFHFNSTWRKQLEILQFFYRSTSRELRRLDSVSRSPIYTSFTETLDGSSTIRAFKSEEYFLAKFNEHVALYHRTSYSELTASLWLSLRLQHLFISFVATMAVIGSGGNLPISFGTPGLVGLALSYAAPIVSLLGSFLTSFTETEKEMVSIERVLEYMDVPQEELSGHQPLSTDWPFHGLIEFQNVTMRYKRSLPAALHDVTFTIVGGTQVGIIGRTGAGKSSVLNALFRLTPICGGRILVDGLDINSAPLRDLRAHLAIVPQSPFLFQGSLRYKFIISFSPFNVDMLSFGVRRKLKQQVDWHIHVKESGMSFSVGQRQLLCLARALLKSSKVLCLDECTANVDTQTASILQNTISSECRGMTVITIAHRISTVLNMDKILILDHGNLVEEGNPQTLMQDESSIFSKFARASTM
ncbi:hypothetical protein Patl1_34753 [Pistacia atlantica]|uniref:Uncharacterized protein n=1 Tax=Pistacia atlantica TaxID=434234 RepID=A0ACC0ZQR3_9ROSI|nr:hypothetical protein Patl1_34753 [Pistacia atlantica]